MKSSLMNNLKIYGALLTVLLLVQCSSAQSTKDKSKEIKGSFSTNRQIEWNENNGNFYVNIVEGEKIVFELSEATGGDPRTDRQIKSTIMFEIPSNSSEFEIKENWLENGAFMVRQCRCIDAGYNSITSGKISGKRTKEGEWEIAIDAEATGNDSGNKYSFNFKALANSQ